MQNKFEDWKYRGINALTCPKTRIDCLVGFSCLIYLFIYYSDEFIYSIKTVNTDPVPIKTIINHKLLLTEILFPNNLTELKIHWIYKLTLIKNTFHNETSSIHVFIHRNKLNRECNSVLTPWKGFVEINLIMTLVISNNETISFRVVLTIGFFSEII